MARATMAGVIEQLREMVGDDQAPYTYSDDSLERTLDEYQTGYRRVPLSRVHVRIVGVETEREFQAPAGAWEDGATFHDGAGAVLTPAAWNGQAGLARFTSQPLPSTIYVTGQMYCLFSSAADVCDKWAGKLARAYDVGSNDKSMRRSQMATSLRQQAKTYRAQVPIRSVSMRRSDVR